RWWHLVSHLGITPVHDIVVITQASHVTDPTDRDPLVLQPVQILDGLRHGRVTVLTQHARFDPENRPRGVTDGVVELADPRGIGTRVSSHDPIIAPRAQRLGSTPASRPAAASAVPTQAGIPTPCSAAPHASIPGVSASARSILATRCS